MKGSSRVWRWRHAVAQSSLHATTKHVLSTLSTWMNSNGGSCYPSVELVAKRSGFTKKTVCTHLKIAEAAGWIEIDKAGFNGRAWRRNEYEARFPDGDDDSSKSATRKSRQNAAGVGYLATDGGVTEAREAGYEVTHVINTPRELSTNSPTADADRGRCSAMSASAPEREDPFDGFRWRHPTSVAESAAKVRAAFDACTPEQQRVGVERHGDWLSNLKKIGRDFVPNGATYWEGRLWEGLPTSACPDVQPSDQFSAPPWSREWWAAILHAAGTGDNRRVSYICTMLREHGRGVLLDRGSERDQVVIALSERMEKVRAGDARREEVANWFAARTGRSLPELPADMNYTFVPNARGWETLKVNDAVADAGV